MVRTTPAERKVRLAKGDKHSRKKEAVVTGLYTIAPHPRTPAEVVASLFHSSSSRSTGLTALPATQTPLGHHGGQRRRPRASAGQVAQREGPHIQQRVGFDWTAPRRSKDRVQQHFPTFTLVLDFIHADEETLGRRQQPFW